MTPSFEHSYARDLPGTYLPVRPDVAPEPKLVALNEGLGRELGFDVAELRQRAAAWFSGAELPPGAAPIALAYAGHQFGGFSAQLGDGRAHLLGEIVTPLGRRVDLQLKGSGPTPFARRGDGKAALGPMLREYLISEAMVALGVPTTRSLAVVTTGETVWRDKGGLPGAVLARVAASHIRVGTFQFFAARRDRDRLAALRDYTIARHFPDLAPGDGWGLLDAVAARQVRLLAEWMGVGFVHGVMNTDNMALSGETIDYGPCAFMEAYAPGTVFSSIDAQGRYAYANQPLILGWNLARLAEALLPVLGPDPERAVAQANDRLAAVAPAYGQAFHKVMARKLALKAPDAGLAEAFLAAIAGADWTLAFRRLAEAAEGQAAPLLALAPEPGPLGAWLARWRAAVGQGPGVAAALRAANPAVIPRNHLVEEALEAAEAGEMARFDALLAAVRDPFGPEAGREGFTLPAPQGFGPYVTFCGT